MKKIILSMALLMFASICANAEIFDATENAVEVKLTPATKVETVKPQVQKPQDVAVYTSGASLKQQKFTSAIVNLDDAQVELRQELADATNRYNEALAQKEKANLTCKNIKKEIKDINKKMKNIDKSKKMINKNIETNK